MMETITKTYATEEALKNVEEDLFTHGIEGEHILIDREKKQVKVLVSKASEPEILEILGRHDPLD